MENIIKKLEQVKYELKLVSKSVSEEMLTGVSNRISELEFMIKEYNEIETKDLFPEHEIMDDIRKCHNL